MTLTLEFRISVWSYKFLYSLTVSKGCSLPTVLLPHKQKKVQSSESGHFSYVIFSCVFTFAYWSCLITHESLNSTGEYTKTKIISSCTYTHTATSLRWSNPLWFVSGSYEGLGQPDYTEQEVRGGRGPKLQTLAHAAAHDKVRRRKQRQTTLTEILQVPEWNSSCGYPTSKVGSYLFTPALFKRLCRWYCVQVCGNIE